MKYLEIDEQVEKMLIAIFDAALKSQGMQVVRLVNEVSARIKEKAAEPSEVK